MCVWMNCLPMCSARWQLYTVPEIKHINCSSGLKPGLYIVYATQLKGDLKATLCCTGDERKLGRQHLRELYIAFTRASVNVTFINL